MGEEELSQSMEALELARARLDALGKQAEMLQMSLGEHVRAIETLKSCRGLPEGKDILVPVGAGTFLPARTTGADWALVGIGAGLTAERSSEEAVASLEKEAAELEVGVRKLVQEMKNLEKQAGMLSQRIQELSQGLPGEEAPQAPLPKPKKPGKKKDEDG